MKRSRFIEVQVAYALRQAEAGTAVTDVCCSLGIFDATFYIWSALARLILATIYSLPFEQTKESFRWGIIGTTTDSGP